MELISIHKMSRLCVAICAALLLLVHFSNAIYNPEYPPEDGPSKIENPSTGRPQGAANVTEDIITVYSGKKKPGAAVPLPPVPQSKGDLCEEPRRRRKRRVTKPAIGPVRTVLDRVEDPIQTFFCPESWRGLDFQSVQELECPENATGWYPFPPDCRKYLNCWNGRGFLQPCAPATLFNPVRRECDYPKKVKCLPQCRLEDESSQYDDMEQFDPLDFVDPANPDKTNPLIDARSLPSGPRSRVGPEESIKQPGRSRFRRSHQPRQTFNHARYSDNSLACTMEGGSGLQAHPTDCNKFLNCAHYKPHVQNCGPGTVFNPRINACDYPYNVPGCSNPNSHSATHQPGFREPGLFQPPGHHQIGPHSSGAHQPGRHLPGPHQSGLFNQPSAWPNTYHQPTNHQSGLGFRQTSSSDDQVAAASTYPGLGPNQVEAFNPKPSRRPPSQRELEFEPPLGAPGDIGHGGFIGPVPPGHNVAWHMQHGVPLPPPPPPQFGRGAGDFGPHRHPPHFYPGHHHNQQQPGGFSHGHDPEWHRRHGVPLPGERTTANPYRPTSTPSPKSYYPRPTFPPPPPRTTTIQPPRTTTCNPPDNDDDFLISDDETTEEPDAPLFGIDVRTGGSSWRTVLERTKNGTIPESGQVVRLRGGPSPTEGYVEILGPGSTWGTVCDEATKWTVKEASIVCRMLGYERGAELAWQGRPRGLAGPQPIHVESVHCAGNERSMLDCAMMAGDAGDRCDVETQAVGLRCHPNWAARCRPGEMPYGGACYSVVVPRVDRKVDAIALSQGEAIAHCKSLGGHLLDINSQGESDFISEWLSSAFPALGTVLTAGVGVSVPGRDVWVWEGTGAPFKYNLWWPGPPREESDSGRAPKVGERSLCVLLKKDFPCDTWPGQSTSDPRERRTGYGSWQGARSCPAEYFFWHAEDCAIRQKAYPYICERTADNVGCLGPNTSEYEGVANVSWNGQSCLSWDSVAAVSALRYRVSDAVRRKSLSGHNYCRRVSNNHEPWCFVDGGLSGVKVERCDIPSCENKVVSRAAIHCGPQQFECHPNECIPAVWQCDGETDCSNGLDEEQCSDYLHLFRKEVGARLEQHDVERWLHLDANTCARRCLDATDFKCKSFSHKSSTKVCHLSSANVGEVGNLVTVDRSEWKYYELKALSDPCNAPDKFLCANKKCLNSTLVCNGRNDCGDRSDESKCSAEKIGWALNLSGGKAKNEGRVEIKVNGIWGGVCDDGFGLPEADVVCREAGYPDGAVEILGSSVMGSLRPLPILVDELICVGNETSIRHCDQDGWGVHDCEPEEMVGVRCAMASGLECNPADETTAQLHGGYSWGSLLELVTKHCRRTSRACPKNQWQCESGECVPAKLLCDSVEDCKDGSDEHSKRCNLPMGMRLSGGRNSSEGRLEVRVYGEWGTVCDDDFNDAAARVACRAMGKPGRAKVYKEAHFGRGQGIIWLDNVKCAGNETGPDMCEHEDFGVTNCEHDEDVGIACLGGKEEEPSKVKKDKDLELSKYLPEECGTREIAKSFGPTVQIAKVVSGRGTPKGSYPWQASIRVRAGAKSVHWCGAVLLGPLHVLTAAHCLQDYTKGAYFVRAGDYDSEIEDGTEQEVNIMSIHIHEDFNKNVYLENDIAIVRIAGAGFRLNSALRPACMPPARTHYSAGTNCSISGWGSVGTSGAGHSRLLRSAWLPILPIESCSAESVYGKKAIVPGMFCAGHLDGGADSCQGDSGGPMVCDRDGRFTLFGIISWGHGCGMANKPGVYSHVAHYLDWIHKTVRQSVLES